MISAVVSGMLALAFVGQATVTVFPLFDPSDPLRLSNAVFSADDPLNPTLVVQLENTTSRSFATNLIWLRAAQFFTPSEVMRNGDNVAYACERLARARFDDDKTTLPPGERVFATFPIGSECDLDAQHVHLFVHVASIGPGPIDAAIWYRDPASFVRLLTAAMPHQ
jgi:hypothetical protein